MRRKFVSLLIWSLIFGAGGTLRADITVRFFNSSQTTGGSYYFRTQSFTHAFFVGPLQTVTVKYPSPDHSLNIEQLVASYNGAYVDGNTFYSTFAGSITQLQEGNSYDVVNNMTYQIWQYGKTPDSYAPTAGGDSSAILLWLVMAAGFFIAWYLFSALDA